MTPFLYLIFRSVCIRKATPPHNLPEATFYAFDLCHFLAQITLTSKLLSSFKVAFPHCMTFELTVYDPMARIFPFNYARISQNQQNQSKISQNRSYPIGLYCMRQYVLFCCDTVVRSPTHARAPFCPYI